MTRPIAIPSGHAHGPEVQMILHLEVGDCSRHLLLSEILMIFPSNREWPIFHTLRAPLWWPVTYQFVSSQSENVQLVTDRMESEGGWDVLITARLSPLMLRTARRTPTAVTISPVKSFTYMVEIDAGNWGSCLTKTKELRSYKMTVQSSDALTISM